jgi:two-component system, NtrC family, nitrogen regulation response regulator NtrX
MLPTELSDQGTLQLLGNSPSDSSILELSLKEARDNFEKNYLQAQVQRFSGNISKTAHFIGMERSALHRKLRALEVERKKSSQTETAV